MAYGGTPQSGASDVLDETTAKQRLVSDPLRSAWVSANAGAGKTHVLIQRVTRLLLAGCEPGRIVCITYTKAAAAEMADRLFKRLSGWALADDDALRDALAEMVGEDEAARADLAAARLLFARALETPGGLKIQTIHSFCEMVLRRFPAEAGLLPGFEVLEEGEARRLQRGVIDRLAAEAMAHDPLMLADFDAAGGVLRPDAGEGGFQRGLHDVLADLAAKGRHVAAAHTAAGGTRAFCDGLYARHDLAPSDTEETVAARLRTALDTAMLREMETAWATGGTTAQKVAGAITDAFADGLPIEAVTGLFLTTKNELPKRGPGDAKARKLIDRFDERWGAMAEAALAAVAAQSALRFCHLNAALHRLTAAVTAGYEREKTKGGRLDFDDLITRTARLLRETSNAWVLYKLDQGIDHVLLDEAQDTGAEQWDVIWQLTDAFYGPEGTASPRTLFVVGDEKQSIYSFQGADAELFKAKREAQEARAGDLPFEAVEFGLSFRSTPPIMTFVDEALRAGDDLLIEKGFARHQSRFPGAPGSVEIWPLIEKGDEEKGQPWDLPVDAAGAGDPNRQLAEAICDRIKAWTDGAEPLPHEGRPVRPGDVMILFQRRGAGFHEMVQALSRRGIPAAGADRVRLKEDVAVRDLIALLRFCANTGDCLSLAELLKSPFWRLDDDDLLALAPGREGRLWRAVRDAAGEGSERARKCAAAVREIEAAMAAGRGEGAFALLTSVLDGTRDERELTGRQRIAERLGTVPQEALDELLTAALAFEARCPRSVEGFLAEIEASAGDVKKEQGGGADAVRVMTVHGAKGLEAPVVILADASYRKDKGALFKAGALVPMAGEGAGEGAGAVLCGAGSDAKTVHWDAACAAADTRRMAEYRRLFYVGATRAEERLIVCGVRTKLQEKPEQLAEVPCEEADWHTLASRAFARMNGRIEATDGPFGAVQRFAEDGPPRQDRRHADALSPADPIRVPWLAFGVETEARTRILHPSGAQGTAGEGDPDTPDATVPAYPPRADGTPNPYLRGTVIHALLERLPDVAPERRALTGHALAARYAAGAPAGSADAWLAEALAVLDDPRFASVFAPGSRAEVPVVGRIGGRAWSGAIDRLVVEESRVLVVDYKSNRPPPEDPERVQADYLDQLAAYAALVSRAYGGRPVECALLWTYAPRLMPVPSALLAGRIG